MLNSMNRFNRLDLLIGEEKTALLSQKCVLVIGVGGVGGYACEALVRSNIGTLIIMDYDTINPTNINRQIIALDDNIGQYKVDVLKERAQKINPNIKVIALKEFYDDDTKEKIFEYPIDFIIDAFDTVKGKIDLINECQKRNIPLISSMGMANRHDPTKIIITKLSKTTNDPVARILRQSFKDSKLPVVASTEVPIKTKKELGSNAWVPATAGLFLASYVVQALIK